MARRLSLNLQNLLIPSGAFLLNVEPKRTRTAGEAAWEGDGNDLSPILLYNPMPHPGISVGESSKVIASDISPTDFLNWRGSGRVVSRIAVDRYAERVVDAGILAIMSDPQFILAPLRGAAKPVQMIQTLMGQDIEIEWLPFQNRSDLHRVRMMEEHLLRILRSRAREQTLLRFVIVDTAKSGHGCKDMCEMLGRAADDMPRVSFHVVFLVLHASKRPSGSVERIEAALATRRDNLAITPHRLDVDDLLVEDWEAALGIAIDMDGQQFSVRLIDEGGTFQVFDGTEIREIRSGNVGASLSIFIAASVSDAVVSDPRFDFYRDVWMEHLRG